MHFDMVADILKCLTLTYFLKSNQKEVKHYDNTRFKALVRVNLLFKAELSYWFDLTERISYFLFFFPLHPSSLFLLLSGALFFLCTGFGISNTSTN